MREALGDLWTYPADIRVITTNGDLNSRGELVMGRGVAKQAKDKYPDIAAKLGAQVKKHGNILAAYNEIGKSAREGGARIWTFPVKHHWHDSADLALIRQSAEKMAQLASPANPLVRCFPDVVIVMPRPGCGNGQRHWAEVKPLLADLLDDRFVVLIWEADRGASSLNQRSRGA